MKIIDLAFQQLDNTFRSQLEQSRTWSKALVVPEDSHAKDVAEIVGLNKMDFVVVIGANHLVKGVVAPDFVARSAMQHLPIAKGPRDFGGIVSEIIKHQKPGKAGFEWLNHARPELYWCEAGNHFSTKKHCPDHRT